MLEQTKELLERGLEPRAREALREVLRDFSGESFARGNLGHPFASPRSSALRGELRSLVAVLVVDPDRGRAVQLALDGVERSIRKKTVEAETLDRLNFALTNLLPDFALILEEGLENARFALGEAASNVENPAAAVLQPHLSWQASLLFDLADAGIRAAKGGRLDRLQALSLRDLDACGPGLAESPPILGLRDETLAFECPGCRERISAPLAAFGEDLRCVCGQPLKVPRPSLERMAAYLKCRRDAERGIGRCKVCSAVIQVRKDDLMRAGYCSGLCARQSRESFGEFVAREGIREGDDLRFLCHCGASISVPLAEVGTKMNCPSCPLEVWVPSPAPPQGRRRELLSCAKCGKPVKSTARRCMYCGTPA